MRFSNEPLFSALPVVGNATSNAIDMSQMAFGDATAAVTDSTPGNKTFLSGVAEVDTFNFPAKAGAADGDYAVQWDYTGAAWAVALDTTGGAANTPTGATWVAIPSANKVYLDISATTTAATVATAVKAGFNALVGFTAVVTASDAAADGHLADTQAWAGVVTAPSVHNKGDTGAGTITVVVTTAGTASAVSPTANTVTVAAHGYVTGLKVRLTTSSALPTGLLTGTDYYLIGVDASTLAFATTLAHALAGTKIALTGYGVGTQTIAVQALAGTIKLQKSNDLFGSPNPLWVDIASSSQAYGAALTWAFNDLSGNFGLIGFSQLQAVAATTGGLATISLRLSTKGG